MAERTAAEAVERFVDLAAGLDDPAVLISQADEGRLRALAAEIDRRDPHSVPLRGTTVAVKDNIDVAGLPTTAGCPAYSYSPHASAPVVEQLIAAGAVPVAKTNLDQFATGLVGTRSPHGTPRNPLDPEHVPGGSSSGSAVAVARGLVSFALGTDTAGSGRVPAAFCGVVGLKPTVGTLSGRGVVPAVRTADCVSVLAPTVGLAEAVRSVVAAFDPADPFARHPRPPCGPVEPAGQRVGVATSATLTSLGADEATVQRYGAVRRRLATIAAEVVEVDLAPFVEAGDLLYDGPLLAERVAAVGEFIATNRDAVDPIVAEIISDGRRYDAVAAHRSAYRLAELRREVEPWFGVIDSLVLPTVPHGARVDEVAADPLGVNERLGRFTTFANLLDLCGISVPVGDRTGPGIPFGVTVYGQAWDEPSIVPLAAALTGEAPSPRAGDGAITLAVAGAHLRGQPLAHQLTELGARFVTTTTTAPTYRLYALADANPQKPALVHDPTGAAIEVDLWELTSEALGRFVGAVPPPLAIGTVELADGTATTGFVSEPRALTGATDITHLGGWRSHVAGLLPTTDGAR